MIRLITAALALVISVTPALSEPDLGRINESAVKSHALPLAEAFQTSAAELQRAAQSNCQPTSPELVAAFDDTFDAWTRMSHLRFGPTETNDRAFAIAFWPDGRGKTPKALAGLLTKDDPTVFSPEVFRTASIAVRGLYALEFLLFDDRVMAIGSEAARCDLVRAIATDTAINAAGINADWQGYAEELLSPAQDRMYRTETEATQEFYKAVLTGLHFTSDTRLGRPLGTFERSRPKRAELWRSGRSLRQIEMSLQGTEELVMVLASQSSGLETRLGELYVTAYEVIADLNDPTFAGVADVQGRLRVEILKISIDEIRELISLELGPALGVAAGFNALDGD